MGILMDEIKHLWKTAIRLMNLGTPKSYFSKKKKKSNENLCRKRSMKSLHDGNTNLIVPSIDYHLTVWSFSALRVYVEKQICVCWYRNKMPCHAMLRTDYIFGDKANFITVDVVVIFFFLLHWKTYDSPPYLNPTTKGLIAYITM